MSPLGLAWLLQVPVCPTALVLRVPCPGCGLTRATMAMLHGDFSHASELNPIALVVCPVLVGGFAYAAYRYVRWGRVDADGWGAGPVLVIAMAALTVVWLLRWFGHFGGPVPV